MPVLSQRATGSNAYQNRLPGILEGDFIIPDNEKFVKFSSFSDFIASFEKNTGT